MRGTSPAIGPKDPQPIHWPSALVAEEHRFRPNVCTRELAAAGESLRWFDREQTSSPRWQGSPTLSHQRSRLSRRACILARMVRASGIASDSVLPPRWRPTLR